VTAAATYDCRACGACCVNLPENAAEGFAWWVEIAAADAALPAKLVVHDGDGVPHLRVVDGGRCIALRGAPGRSVRCAVYHHRPSPCRRVQPGGALCRRYRLAHGLTP